MVVTSPAQKKLGTAPMDRSVGGARARAASGITRASSASVIAICAGRRQRWDGKVSSPRTATSGSAARAPDESRTHQNQRRQLVQQRDGAGCEGAEE